MCTGGFEHFPIAVQADERRKIRWQAIQELAFGNKNRGGRVLKHECQAVPGKFRIQRNVGAARLPNCEGGDRQISRTIQAECDEAILPNSQFPKPVSQAIRTHLQFPVSQLLIVANCRDGPWSLACLPIDPLMDATVRKGEGRSVILDRKSVV